MCFKIAVNSVSKQQQLIWNGGSSLVYHGRQLSKNTSASLCKEAESTLIVGHNNFHENEFNSQVYN
jgi:hypothetical protein